MNLTEQFNSFKSEHKNNPYPTCEERKALLLALSKALKSKASDFANAINQDFTHRSIQETMLLEVFPALTTIKYALNKLSTWMKDRPRQVSLELKPAYAYLSPQPVGVVGIMVPWNYPLLLALSPAIYALAAGNRVMIKMSELSPKTGLALDALIKSIGLEQHIAIVNGDVALAKEFASLPFGHLLFTGSTAVGKQVMKAASENLTPVTLELGGKSPAVLSKTMNMKYFKRLFMGKLFNAGQTCVAPDYLFIPEGWEGQVEVAFQTFIDAHYPHLMTNDDYTNMISESHKQRVLALVEDAVQKGARVVQYGESTTASTKTPVYLLFDVTQSMNVMHEEIFGPVLPVITYQAFDEVIEHIKDTPNPLALYYFGEDQSEIEALKTQTLSGAFIINNTVIHCAVDDLPFGGVGQSGMGQYHGQEGFDTFSKLKPVMVQRQFSSMTWLYPPYGRMVSLVLAKLGGIRF